MKKEYLQPDIEVVKFSLASDILALSDPEPTIGGGGNVHEPGEGDEPFDPFA